MFLWCVKVIAISSFVSVTNAEQKHTPRQGKIFSFELENEDVEDFHAPMRRIEVKKYLVPWFIADIKSVMKQRNKAKSRYRKLSTDKNYATCKKLSSSNVEVFHLQALRVALDFSIPFVKIPIKKTLNAITGFGVNEMNFPNININPIALSLGGLLIAFTTILTPFLKKTLGFDHFDRSSRGDDFNKYSSFDISENLITNSRSCPERIACWASQKSISPAVIETWKQIMSNGLLSNIVNTTALEAATLKGLKGQNCESYAPCPIQENSLPKIIKSLEILTNSKFS